jgi:hypothetical protein
MNTSLPLIKSRQNLLEFTNNYLELEKHSIFNTVLKHVWEIVRESIREQKTTCRFNPDNLEYTLFCQTYVRSYNNLITRHSVNMEFMDVLRKEYPDCTIDYLETKGQEGTIVERTFILDWSDESKA